MKYRDKKGRKWIVMVVLAVAMGFLGWEAMPFFYSLSKSNYDRKGIEKICAEMFGNVKIIDAITKEVNIVAYDYNSHEPRIFSKYSASKQPSKYEVLLA